MLSQRFAWVCVFLLASLLAFGGAAPGQPGREPSPPDLVFSLEYWSSRGHEDSSGVVIAAWSDGVVVFASDAGMAGRQMMVGHLTGEQIVRVKTELREARFFEVKRGGGTAPDASYWQLWASDAEGNGAYHSCMWNEARFGPRTATVDADEDVRAFAKMWALSRVALAFAYPEVGARRPLEEAPEVQKRLRKIGSSYFLPAPHAKQP